MHQPKLYKRDHMTTNNELFNACIIQVLFMYHMVQNFNDGSDELALIKI